METMETQGISTDDVIFCGCAGAFLLVNLLVYCHEAPVLCRTWYGKVKSLRWRDWYPTIRQEDQIREAFVYRETCARKVIWARRFISLFVPVCACALVPVLYNIWARNERWMSVAFSWSFLLVYISFLTVHLMPSFVTASVLDFICLVAHGFMAFWLSPLGSPNFDDVLILQLLCFMMGQIVFVSIAAHYTAVFLSQGLTVGVVLWRMFAETDFAAGAPDTVVNPRTLVLCNLFCTGAVVAIHNVANRLIRHTVETAMRASDSNRHLSAASALLELTCDAVCEIDKDLKLQSHSQKLATMLLRQSGASLEGRKLTDFIAPGEAERAEEILMSQSDRAAAAHAFHTHLVDSYSSKFRTEIFQVKYAMMDGREFHLLGLRDFTDLKSLAGENATDAIHDEYDEFDLADAASAESHGRGVHALDVEPSYQLPPDLDCWDASESDRSNAPLEQNESENVLVEKRLKHAHKDAFLEIDMYAEMVEAASAPFCSLAGKSVSQSFASDFCKLLHRLCEDAVQFNAQQRSQDFKVPDQVATFEAMPIYVDRSITMASGVMKVSLTRYGGLKVIMCVNHSEVQNTMTNSLNSFTSKSPEGTDMSPLSL